MTPQRKRKGKSLDDANSLAQLPIEKLAWLAGIFQAEAYFSLDKRVRSKSTPSEYTPPPPVPFIKLEMVEEDLMNEVGALLNENVLPQNRKTSANKTVYRVTLQSRVKVEAFLKAIYPFVVGQKTRTKIEELLIICEEYNDWLAAGGKTKAAKVAARAKANKKRPPT